MIKIVKKGSEKRKEELDKKCKHKNKQIKNEELFIDKIGVSLSQFLLNEQLNFVLVKDFHITNENGLFFIVEILFDNNVIEVEIFKKEQFKIEADKQCILLPFYKKELLIDYVDMVEFALIQEELQQDKMFYYIIDNIEKELILQKYIGYKIKHLRYLLLSLIKKGILTASIEKDILYENKEILSRAVFDEFDNFPFDVALGKFENLDYTNLLPSIVIKRFNKKILLFKRSFRYGFKDLKRISKRTRKRLNSK